MQKNTKKKFSLKGDELDEDENETTQIRQDNGKPELVQMTSACLAGSF